MPSPSLRERIREFGWPSVAAALPGWLKNLITRKRPAATTSRSRVAVLQPPLIEAGEQDNR